MNLKELSNMPLRFRVWDTISKKFLENDELLDFSNGFTNFYDKEMVMAGGRDFIISQDTGIKDKNGKSIYTGDIVDFAGRIMVIKYDLETGQINIIGTKVEFPIFRTEALIIIGNIWEDPELLEEKV